MPWRGLIPASGSIFDLPIRSAGVPVVLCLDVLEHISSEDRLGALRELVRISDRRLVFAVPTGMPAMVHDAEMAAYYELQRGRRAPFFAEHPNNGLHSTPDSSPPPVTANLIPG